MGSNRRFKKDFCLKMSAELACTYAALILNDDGVDITADKITSILKAANVSVEPFWPGLFAGALKDVNVSDLISNIGSGAGAAAPAGGAAEEAKEEAKKESSSEESDDDMGFGLFD